MMNDQNQKKKNEWVIVAFSAIILLLLLAGFVYYRPTEKEKSSEKSDNSSNSSDIENTQEEVPEAEKITLLVELQEIPGESNKYYSFLRDRFEIIKISKTNPVFRGEKGVFIPGNSYALRLRGKEYKRTLEENDFVEIAIKITEEEI